MFYIYFLKIQDDGNTLYALLNTMLKTWQLDEKIVDKSHAEEMVRYGGCEMHTIAAIVGGVASQEIVKLITHQFVPLNNTYIFNGISGEAAVFEL